MDQTRALQQLVVDAKGRGQRLRISGAGSKSAWMPDCPGDVLSMLDHTGVVDYQPDELVVTVRTGTPIKELDLVLAQSGQRLISDPPQFKGAGTVGGAVAAGLSGPGRPWQGALRDAVLGVKLINGLGECLSFGGQVMKNVAGYDVARLLAGGWGSLGVITEVSLRVHPEPQQITLSKPASAQDALALSVELGRASMQFAGMAWLQDKFYVRCTGPESQHQMLCDQYEFVLDTADQVWPGLRDQRLDFFTRSYLEDPALELWRVVVPASAPVPSVDPHRLCIDWGGGLRWVWHDAADVIPQYANAAQGWCWRVGDTPPIEPAQMRVMYRLQEAFDPDRIFTSPLFLESVT